MLFSTDALTCIPEIIVPGSPLWSSKHDEKLNLFYKYFINLWDNLREVSHRTNHMNKPLQSNNKSGHHGVRWDKSRNKWKASIKIKGKKIHIGRYDSKEEAIQARKDTETKYGFHMNHGVN